MEIPSEKSETMAILGQDRVRCEIVVDNKCLQYVQTFKYLGCEISYKNDKDDFLRCDIRLCINYNVEISVTNSHKHN
jgi:hypothetical protein